MPTDFHSHILPKIDDGSRSTAQSLTMLRMEAEQGITRVIATPHFYAHHDDPERFLARRAAAAETLAGAMADQVGLPEIELAAEVYYFPGMSDSEILSQLTIGGKGCILIEMPPAPWTPQMFRELEWIYTKQDLLPVIAHLDRYISPLGTHGIPARLAELPVMVQANAGFFLRRGTAGFARKLLRRGLIHVLGSDCHDTVERPPNLGPAADAIRTHMGQEALSYIREQEARILAAAPTF